MATPDKNAWKQAAQGQAPAGASKPASWKPSGPTAPPSGPSWLKSAGLWIGVVVVGMLAIAGVIIVVLGWVRPDPAPTLVLIEAGYEGNLAVPHNAYGRQAVRALAAWAAAHSEQQTRGDIRKVAVKKEPLEPGGEAALKALESLRGGWGAKAPKKVVVFVAAHGLALPDKEDGSLTAYLVPEGHDPTKNDGLVKLDALLDALAKLPSTTQKLLILDACGIGASWPLGQFAPGFAVALESRHYQDRIKAIPALAVLSLPLVIGRLRAQTLPPPPQYTYEVVAIRPSQPGETRSRLGPGPQGGVRALNNTAMQLLTFAYDVREFQFADAPGWVTSSRFDVTLTPDKPEPTPGPGMPLDQAKAIFSRHSQRMQAVLRDRFGLVLRVQTRDLPYYSLTVAKSGVKLRTPENKVPGTHLSTTRGELTGRAVDMSMLVRALSSLVGRHVKDETGLAGSYDFQMKWAGDDAGGPATDPNAASIFTAITEQLGLKLESARGPVPVYVIEKISKPTEN